MKNHKKCIKCKSHHPDMPCAICGYRHSGHFYGIHSNKGMHEFKYNDEWKKVEQKNED